MTVRYSNQKFFQALGPQPRENIGWEVIVLSHTDLTSILAYVTEWSEISWTKELSGEGTGSITVDLDSEFFQESPVAVEEIIDRPNVWQFYYDGILRHEWLSEKLDEKLLDAGESRTVTISGPGTVAILKEAVVLPPGYPDVTGAQWSFTETTQAGMFLQLLEAAQSRGLLEIVKPMFTTTHDTKGDPWTDVTSMSETNGISLFERLKRVADVAQCDFVMAPRFSLLIQKEHGQHAEARTIFYPMVGQLERGRKRDREGIRNYVLAIDSEGNLSSAADGGSMDQWRRREMWVEAGTAQDSAARDATANAALREAAEEAREWTLKVDPLLSSPRKVFEDYDLGWWIGVDVDPARFSDISTILSLRIVAMSGKVDADGKFDLELTLETIQQSRAKRMKDAVSKIGGDTATSTAPTPISVTDSLNVVLSSYGLKNLADVENGTADDGDSLFWNEATSQWEFGAPNLAGYKGWWETTVAYPAGSLVMHDYGDQDLLYGTWAGTDAGEEPGVSPMWDALGGAASGGGTTRVVEVISANTLLGSTAGTDYVYVCTAALTATLPTAVGNKNLYTVKRTGTGDVTIATMSSQTIDGASNFVLDVQYQSVDLVSDGTKWVVI